MHILRQRMAKNIHRRRRSREDIVLVDVLDVVLLPLVDFSFLVVTLLQERKFRLVVKS
jgi:hypothetical protein